jgi:hypothetical protein
MKKIIFALVFVLFIGCDSIEKSIVETSEAFILNPGVNISVILKTPLSTNKNERGDKFISSLKKPITYQGQTILAEGTEIQGLVKRVTKHEKFGDRAGFALIFDQIVLSDGMKLPLAASLDTDKGSEVIKSSEKEINNAKIVGGSTIVGAMVGKAALGKGGTQKGIILGAAAGTSAVIIGNMKEVNLTAGTELILKLDEPLIIPKQ